MRETGPWETDWIVISSEEGITARAMVKDKKEAWFGVNVSDSIYHCKLST